MRNKALIFAALGCAGVVATALTAIFESKKVCEAIDKIEIVDEHETIVSKARRTIWDYKGTIIVGSLTIGSIIVSQVIPAKIIAGLTASCAGAIANRESLLKTMREYTTDDPSLAREIEINSILRQYPDLPIRCIEDAGYGNTLCCFAFTNRWFLSSEESVREQLNIFNEDLVDELTKTNTCGGYRSLNDIYAALNIFPDQMGERYGLAPEYYYDSNGILFDLERVSTWRDNAGIEHDCDILLIRFDERQTTPFECYFDT